MPSQRLDVDARRVSRGGSLKLMKITLALAASVILQASSLSASAEAPTSPPAPWMQTSLSPERRAALAVSAMTLDEKISLVHGRFPLLMRDRPSGLTPHAGYFPRRSPPRDPAPPRKRR